MIAYAEAESSETVRNPQNIYKIYIKHLNYAYEYICRNVCLFAKNGNKYELKFF